MRCFSIRPNTSDGALGDGIDDALATFRAVVAQDRRVALLEIRHHLAKGAPRCAPADVLGFQHRHVDAGFGEVQGGGQPGEAGPDHRGRDMPPGLKWGGRRGWRRVARVDLGRRGLVR